MCHIALRPVVAKLLFVIVIASVAVPLHAQNRNLSFRQITPLNGLSHNNITSTLQDNHGFMWLGTRDGLNKYDGYTFTVYRNNINDEYSVSNNFITDIVESPDGGLWIGTWGGGVNYFNRQTEKFYRLQNNPNDPRSLANNIVRCLELDHEGLLWIGTDNGGLSVYDPANGTFTNYRHEPGNFSSLSNNSVADILEDHNHTMWIATANGLGRYDPAGNNFTNLYHDTARPQSLSYNEVEVLYEDKHQQLWIGTHGGGLDRLNTETNNFDHFPHAYRNNNGPGNDFILSLAEDDVGNLWVGTENAGLSIFNPRTQTFTSYTHDDIDLNSIGGKSIWSLYRDSRNNMWVGTYAKGISLLSKEANKFAHYRHSGLPTSLSDNNVIDLFEDSRGNLWVGTDGGGLNLLDRKTGHFKHYRHQEGNKASICGDFVISLAEDSRQKLWIGTWGDGVTVLDPVSNTYTHFKHDPKNPHSLSSNNVWALLKDKDRNMWIGSYDGLNLFDRKTNSFIRFKHDPDDSTSISSDKVISLFEDKKGNLWIGTDGSGLNLYNPATRTFKRFQHRVDRKNSLSNDCVNQIFEDSKGNLWVSTMSGLNLFDTEKMTFKALYSEDGLPSDAVFGILEDNRHNLWIGTNNGLSRYTPENGKFLNFTVSDGLQSKGFKRHAFQKSYTGAMYFGGGNGFNEFYPDSIQVTNYVVPIAFTDFQLLNIPVPIAGDAHPESPLRMHISEAKSLKLNYTNSVISFGFAAMAYVDDDRKIYSYKLEGFDNDWINESTQRAVTYTNLDPGYYVLRVKARDREGIWTTPEIRMPIMITPPFWKTWWFRSVSILLVIGAVWSVYWWRTRTMKRHQEKLERLVMERTEQLEAQTTFLKEVNDEIRQQREQAEQARSDAERANRAKSVFLATMSHEIRTPMNGVLGMASLLVGTPLNAEQREYADTIRSSGEALLTVINDVLDFSKIESGNLELDNHSFDLRQCLEEVMDVFSGKATQKELDLVYQIDYQIPAQITGDSHRLRQILLNLIGNAMKFTNKGEIFVAIRLQQAAGDDLTLAVDVKDTGIGIEPDKLSRLFKAFSQVDSSTTRKYGGTGLGLAISKRLVELMGGSITITSEPGAGSTFSFTFCCQASKESVRQYISCNTAGNDGKRILVVDDNQTNLTILKSQLEQWNLISVLASSGAEALAILNGPEKFDAVITDMQMPAMDGVSLTREIKAQHHALPVILLSSIGDESKKQYANLFFDVLNKPVRQQQLCRVIQSALRPATTTATRDESSPMPVLPDDFSKRYPLRILVAEDNPVNQKLTLRILSKLGYTSVDLAHNGLEAVEKFDEKFFDVILMDVQMPEMDGLEATRLIRTKRYHQPIIISMTANAMQGDRELCLQAGMNDYISKPVKLEALVSVLEKWGSPVAASRHLDNFGIALARESGQQPD